MDLDDDGWLDLLVTGYFKTSMLRWNDRGSFIDGTTSANVRTEENGMSSAAHDIDRGGRLDGIVTGIYHDCSSEPNGPFGHSGKFRNPFVLKT